MIDIFRFSVSPLELLVRGTVIYWFLLLLFRFVLRRDSGSAAVPDLLFVVLLGDAAQNGMIGQGQTVADAVALIVVLAVWNYALDVVGFYVPLVERLADPPPVLLVRNGRLLARNLRREHLTREQLQTAMRGEGVETFDAVRKMYLEPDGKMTVIKKDG